MLILFLGIVSHESKSNTSRLYRCCVGVNRVSSTFRKLLCLQLACGSQKPSETENKVSMHSGPFTKATSFRTYSLIRPRKVPTPRKRDIRSESSSDLAKSSSCPGRSVSSTWPTLNRRRGFGTGTSEEEEAQPRGIERARRPEKKSSRKGSLDFSLLRPCVGCVEKRNIEVSGVLFESMLDPCLRGRPAEK